MTTTTNPLGLAAKSYDFFVALAKDAPNWGGFPWFDGNIGAGRSAAGMVGYLVRKGLITSESDGEQAYCVFTDAGVDAAARVGIDLTPYYSGRIVDPVVAEEDAYLMCRHCGAPGHTDEVVQAAATGRPVAAEQADTRNALTVPVDEPVDGDTAEIEAADEREARRTGGTFVGRYLNGPDGLLAASRTSIVCTAGGHDGLTPHLPTDDCVNPAPAGAGNPQDQREADHVAAVLAGDHDCAVDQPCAEAYRDHDGRPTGDPTADPSYTCTGGHVLYSHCAHEHPGYATSVPCARCGAPSGAVRHTNSANIEGGHAFVAP